MQKRFTIKKALVYALVIGIVFENTTGLYGYVNGEYLNGAGWVPKIILKWQFKRNSPKQVIEKGLFV